MSEEENNIQENTSQKINSGNQSTVEDFDRSAAGKDDLSALGLDAKVQEEGEKAQNLLQEELDRPQSRDKLENIIDDDKQEKLSEENMSGNMSDDKISRGSDTAGISQDSGMQPTGEDIGNISNSQRNQQSNLTQPNVSVIKKRDSVESSAVQKNAANNLTLQSTINHAQIIARDNKNFSISDGSIRNNQSHISGQDGFLLSTMRQGDIYKAAINKAVAASNQFPPKNQSPTNFVKDYMLYQDQSPKKIKEQHGGGNLSVTAGPDSQADTADLSDRENEKFRLPNIVSQKTNVLTGAQTSYYKQKETHWNGLYRDLVNYQTVKEKNKLDLRGENNHVSIQSSGAASSLNAFESSLLRKAGKTLTTTQTAPANFSLPVRGKAFHVNDRERYHLDRGDLFQQMNEEAKTKTDINEMRLKSVHEANNERLEEGQRLLSSSKIPDVQLETGHTANLERQSAYQQVQSSQFQLENQYSANDMTRVYGKFNSSLRGRSSQGSRHMMIVSESLNRNPSGGLSNMSRSQLRIKQAKPTIFINQKQDSPSLYLKKGTKQGQESLYNPGAAPISTQNNTTYADNEGFPKQAPVIDINMRTRIPRDISHRKNKNDFFRFLLEQNYHAQFNAEDPSEKRLAHIHGNYRMNNDVLIPRSILKKSLVGGARNRKMNDENEDSFRNHIIDMTGGNLDLLNQFGSTGMEDEETEFLRRDEALVGKRLHKEHMLLSPKIKDVIQSFDKFKQFAPAPNQTEVITSSVPQDELNGAVQTVEQSCNVTTGIEGSTIGVTQKDTKSILRPSLKHPVESLVDNTSYEGASNYMNSSQGGQPLGMQQRPRLAPGVTPGSHDSGNVGDYQYSNTKLPTVSGADSEASSKGTTKLTIRHARPDRGVFKTGVEVIEHEIEVPGEGLGDIAVSLPGGANLTDKQLREMLQNLKQQKIFGFNSFEDFASEYFNRDLVAVEELNRVQWIKEARKKYENRWSKQLNNTTRANYSSQPKRQNRAMLA